MMDRYPIEATGSELAPTRNSLSGYEVYCL